MEVGGRIRDPQKQAVFLEEEKILSRRLNLEKEILF